MQRCLFAVAQLLVRTLTPWTCLTRCCQPVRVTAADIERPTSSTRRAAWPLMSPTEMTVRPTTIWQTVVINPCRLIEINWRKATNDTETEWELSTLYSGVTGNWGEETPHLLHCRLSLDFLSTFPRLSSFKAFPSSPHKRPTNPANKVNKQLSLPEQR